jgi:hypothetical protein
VNLQKICSFHLEHLTEFSCSVTNVDEFECTVESSRLMVACGRIDPVNECCDQVCQNAILDAARKIALNGMSNMDGFPVSPEHSTRIDDCKNIVCRLCVSIATAELPHQLASLELCCITWHEVTES